jgi:hypothetical protein
MATKTKAASKKAQPESKETQPEDGSVLKTAAEAIGSAVGTIAAKSGVVGPEQSRKPRPAKAHGKLQKKNKQRLPRKEKKRRAKAQA